MDARNYTTVPDFAGYLDDRVADGVARVDRAIYTDPDLYRLELEHIWEGNWIYLAHESQIPRPNDYLSLYMGRQPVILVRGPQGEINAFINACAHRGTTLVRDTRGNRADFSCPFHGWVFDTLGELKVVFKEEGAGYPRCFDKKQHGLTRVARVESYRGFIFGSLRADVPALREHLGPAAAFVDLLVDQSPHGLEVLKGSSTYTFKGNWKIQAENGVDGYHLYATHGNYVMTTERRRKLRGDADPIKAMQVAGIAKQKGGFFDLGHGHTVLWGDFPNARDRPNWSQREAYVERFGEARAHWMVNRLRNLLLYPNVFLMDQTSTQIRVFRPLAVDETEVTIYCIAPVGEAPSDRAHRIRQWEDFFNASGMATPDDIMEFRQSQIGFHGRAARWSDLSRGLEHLHEHAPNAEAAALGIEVPAYGTRLEDEGIMLAQHRWWLESLSRAAGRPAGA